MTRYSQLLRSVFAFVALLVAAQTAFAHEYRPALLDISVRPDGVADVLWRTEDTTVDSMDGASRSTSPAHVLRPSISPDRCEAGPVAEQLHDRRTIERRWEVRCQPPTLHGTELTIAGLPSLPIEAFVRVRWTADSTSEFVLRGTANSRVLEETGVGPFGRGGTIGAVMRVYGILGVEHILLGPDHLLFVLGLLLLVTNFWSLFKTVTGFTVGHSITLTLAALGMVELPGPPVEALIALSILLLAAEAIRSRATNTTTLASKSPWVVAAAFGLLHGLGFAGALGDLGLPPDRLPSALLAFNLGVELGQVLFVAAVLIIAYAGRRFVPRSENRARTAVAWCVGTIGGYWFVERVWAILSQ
jgi:hydrogenase/urease accessory protein HupE